MAAFKNLKSAGTVVFAHSKTDWGKLPNGAQAGKQKAGRIIPMVFVTNSDGDELIDVITYEELAEDPRKAARELKKFVKEQQVSSESEAKNDAPAEQEELLAESQEWTNLQGKSITAAIQSANQQQVIFIIKDKPITYPLNKLSPDSQEKIKALLIASE